MSSTSNRRASAGQLAIMMNPVYVLQISIFNQFVDETMVFIHRMSGADSI
jgi:hypothetical protein